MAVGLGGTEASVNRMGKSGGWQEAGQDLDIIVSEQSKDRIEYDFISTNCVD